MLDRPSVAFPRNEHDFWRRARKVTKSPTLTSTRHDVAKWDTVTVPTAAQHEQYSKSLIAPGPQFQTRSNRSKALATVVFISVGVVSMGMVAPHLGAGSLLLATISALVLAILHGWTSIASSFEQFQRKRLVQSIDDNWKTLYARRHRSSIPDGKYDHYAIRVAPRMNENRLQLLHYRWIEGNLKVAIAHDELLPQDLYQQAERKTQLMQEAEDLELAAWHTHCHQQSLDEIDISLTQWQLKLAAEQEREQQLMRQTRVQAMRQAFTSR
jgi:hypothetical protein